MIYFDNSATTFPKPQAVYWAVNNSLKQYGANPGRSGHSLSMASANQVYKSREKVARFFNAPIGLIISSSTHNTSINS